MNNERKNLYFFYRQTEEVLQKITPLISLAKQHGFTIVDDAQSANVIVAIGGDGAFLQAVRKTGFRNDALYVGMSTGELGFYCDFTIEDHEGLLHAMKSENIEVRKYPTLKVTIDEEDTTFHCLNECSIRSSVIKTFAMDVFIDDLYFETFRGDGMIVSTPTGSTAYTKSLNGSIVDPMLRCYQVSELASLNNNHYRTLGSSFLLSDQRKLTFKIQQENSQFPIIGMDNEALSSKHSEVISFQLSDVVIKTVKLKNNSFWHKVKRSFL
ncbi:inorganic polyphosphate/ATP-NAD kinase [Fictibacillus macauensis ZFHKF-1]|uniref:NAD kinase n=1 Tax=Fictibacillus macauensis ZFHKF-1 TaxID=1196324 RepID=I8UF17_9BACL|nr:NAD kinase [Fictibacillus macauensis]EIT85465.1 inorganic polyphosphate/ATP-NAD kinase [Fictibacillus macauensis ZFHKF-1]